MGTIPTMTKTPILTIAAPALLVLLSASTSAGEPLELSARITRVDACGGWPSFVTLKDGSILAVRGDRARTSADGGKTWSRPRPFVAHPKMGIKSILRLNSGKLGVILVRVEGIPNVGHDAENFRQMTVSFATSADEGKTWSEAVRMNRYNTNGSPHVDTLIQTRKGRLILPVRTGFAASRKTPSGAFGIVNGKRRKIGGHTTYPEMDISFCYLSDDEGKTWRKSRGFIFGWDHGKRLGCFPCDEPVVIELKDGRILMMCRTTIGQLYRVYSDDGGENWGPPEPSGLASAYAPCMIRRIPTTGDLVIIWNQASHEEIRSGYERNRLSIAISRDDGKTWTRCRTVFRSHLPAVGLLNPGEFTGHVAIKKFVGEIPTDFSSADYPNIHFHKDTILLHYDRNLKFGPKRGAYWTLKVFRISDLYE